MGKSNQRYREVSSPRSVDNTPDNTKLIEKLAQESTHSSFKPKDTTPPLPPSSPGAGADLSLDSSRLYASLDPPQVQQRKVVSRTKDAKGNETTYYEPKADGSVPFAVKNPSGKTIEGVRTTNAKGNFEFTYKDPPSTSETNKAGNVIRRRLAGKNGGYSEENFGSKPSDNYVAVFDGKYTTTRTWKDNTVKIADSAKGTELTVTPGQGTASIEVSTGPKPEDNFTRVFDGKNTITTTWQNNTVKITNAANGTERTITPDQAKASTEVSTGPKPEDNFTKVFDGKNTITTTWQNNTVKITNTANGTERTITTDQAKASTEVSTGPKPEDNFTKVFDGKDTTTTTWQNNSRKITDSAKGTERTITPGTGKAFTEVSTGPNPEDNFTKVSDGKDTTTSTWDNKTVMITNTANGTERTITPGQGKASTEISKGPKSEDNFIKVFDGKDTTTTTWQNHAIKITNDSTKIERTITPGTGRQYSEVSKGPKPEDNFTKVFDGRVNTYRYADGTSKTEVNSLRRLNDQTLAKTAEQLHDAIHHRSYLLSSPDRKAIFSILGSLNEGDREKLSEVYRAKYNTKTPVNYLKTELASYLGSDSADFRQAEAFMNRRDNTTNDAGALMVALAKVKDDATAGSALIRNIFLSLNADQIKQMSEQFKKDYGLDYHDALSREKQIDQQTVEALKPLEKGIDKLTANDRVKLAEIAAKHKDLQLFSDAVKGDLPSAVEARTLLKSNDVFRLSLYSALTPYSQPAGISGLDTAAWSTPPMSIARDYLNDGRISLATITGANTSVNPAWNWLFANHENIELACRNASNKERSDFALGQKLSLGHLNPSNKQERETLSYYQQLHKAFGRSASERETSIWEDQIVNGRKTFITNLAETHSDSWVGGGHYVRDMMNALEDIKEDDWNLMKRDPQMRQRLESSLGTYATKAESDRIISLFDAKCKASSYADSKNMHRSLRETIADSKERGWFSSEQETKSIIRNLADLSARDAQLYKSDRAFRSEVDQFLGNDFGGLADRVFARRVLSEVSATGKPPKLDRPIDKLLLDRCTGADPTKLITDAEEVLKDTQLRARLYASSDSKNNVRLTEEELAIKAVIQIAIIDACHKNDGALEQMAAAKQQELMRTSGQPHQVGQVFASYGSDPRMAGHPEIANLTNSLFSKGKLSLGEKALAQFDHGELMRMAAQVTEAERRSCMHKFSEEEKSVINFAAQQGGRLTLADRIMRFIASDKEIKSDPDIGAELSKLSGDEVQLLKEEYSRKYKRELVSDLITRVGDDERSAYRDSLTTGEVDGKQTFYENVTRLLNNSGTAPDGTAITSQKSLDEYASALQAFSANYKNLPPEKRAALDEYFNEALKQHQQSKERLGELLAEAAITTVAIAAAPETGGASLSLLVKVAAGGAAARLAIMKMTQGNDFDTSAANLSKQILLGGSTAALSATSTSMVVGLNRAVNKMATNLVAQAASAGENVMAETTQRALQKELVNLIHLRGKDVDAKCISEVLKRVAPRLEAGQEKLIREGILASLGAEYSGVEKAVEIAAKLPTHALVGSSRNVLSQLTAAIFEPEERLNTQNLRDAIIAGTIASPLGQRIKNFRTSARVISRVIQGRNRDVRSEEKSSESSKD